MNPIPSEGRIRRRALVALACSAAAVVACLGLSGFHAGLHEIDPAGSDRTSELTTAEVIGIRTFAPQGGFTIEPDVAYGTREDGTRLDLDVCAPSADPVAGAQRIGILSIHGGSWTRGDKANDDWRRVCEWLASEGFVAFSVNYRLVPDAPFPAAIDDVTLAVEWMREHADDYGIDPDRIGAFGGSAGGNLAALLATQGAGPLDTGSRVAAVAELSGPIDLTDAAMRATGSSGYVTSIALAYLGCESLAQCPQAADASATSFIDPSDPPVFIAHSDAEFVPLAQSRQFAAALAASGIESELAVSPGSYHSIGLLDEAMRARVADFFRRTLGTPVVEVPVELADAAQG